MNLATVIGSATATIKHPSMNGWRLLVVQPLTADGGPDGEPLLAIDSLGARRGSQVIITSDGKAVSEALGTNRTPVRWMVMAQPDVQHDSVVPHVQSVEPPAPVEAEVEVAKPEDQPPAPAAPVKRAAPRRRPKRKQ